MPVEIGQKKILSSFFWKFIERCCTQGITIIVSLILARLLDPAAYGLVSLVTVFTAILDVFVDSGLGSALVQKKDASNHDFSTVFYFNIVFCLLLYALMVIFAPYIALFYKDESLVLLVRVMSLSVVISGLKNIQQTYIIRNLLFKKNIIAVIIGVFISGIIGIAMAFQGWGVWALVVQTLLNQAIVTLVLWFLVPWRPMLYFSWARLKKLLSFGINILFTSLATTFYDKIRQLVIGKFYSTADLAYYNQGMYIPYAVYNNVNSVMDSVLFPTMSANQDELIKVKKILSNGIKTATFIVSPLLMILAAVCEPLIRVVLTEKWVPCCFFIQVFCFSYLLSPLQSINANAIKALGHSSLIFKQTLERIAIGLAVLLISMPFGSHAIAIGVVVSNVLGVIITCFPGQRLFNYSLFQQLKDALASLLISIAMGLLIHSLSFFGMNDVLTILIQIILGIAIYIAISIPFNKEIIKYLLSLCRHIK